MSSRMRITLAVVCSVGALLIMVLAVFIGLATQPPWRSGPRPAGVAPSDKSEIVVDTDPIDDGGFTTAAEFTGPIHDPTSLRDLRESIQFRGRLGLAVLQAEVDGLKPGFRPTKEEVGREVGLRHAIGLLNLYEGRLSEAGYSFEAAQKIGRPHDVPAPDRAQRMILLGLVALRDGKSAIGQDGPAAPSDPFPIVRQAIDDGPALREAVDRFTAYLEKWPDDRRVRWLLNLAHMKRGGYPGQVPRKYVVALDRFHSKRIAGPFEDVAQQSGLNSRGPTLAGGTVFDDFTGDGLPDIFATSVDCEKGATLFVNQGDRTFRDDSPRAGLGDQIYALNAASADFDNDGDLDILLTRGGRDGSFRLSLLRNSGNGHFDDTTANSGLGEPIAGGSAAWGDYDNDGWIDVFVCGLDRTSSDLLKDSSTSSRSCCRLYRNRGDGTFTDVADKAGVSNRRLAMGAAWGDYDGDGWLDLFVSNFDAPCRLFHNERDGTFRDDATRAGVVGPVHHRSTVCWFWDFDNDGRLDLFVNDAHASLADVVASYLGQNVDDAGHPHLYRNIGPQGFRDVSREAGLDRPLPALAANFGDIDNDGYLDIYFALGWPSMTSAVPNVLLQNVEGKRFEDVTLSSRTGYIHKSQCVSFADWDSDGDLDLFVNAGGAVPGDRSNALLLDNSGQRRHWLKIKLVGTRTNRAAVGAEVRVAARSTDGPPRSIHRTLGNNSSSGGNSIVETIGLGDATSVAELTVLWPVSRNSQTFRAVASDQEIEITEGADSYTVRRRPQLAPPHR
jgi:hypothetical protein